MLRWDGGLLGREGGHQYPLCLSTCVYTSLCPSFPSFPPHLSSLHTSSFFSYHHPQFRANRSDKVSPLDFSPSLKYLSASSFCLPATRRSWEKPPINLTQDPQGLIEKRWDVIPSSFKPPPRVCFLPLIGTVRLLCVRLRDQHHSVSTCSTCTYLQTSNTHTHSTCYNNSAPCRLLHFLMMTHSFTLLPMHPHMKALKLSVPVWVTRFELFFTVY